MDDGNDYEWWRSGAPAFVVRFSRVFGVTPLIIDPQRIRISRALLIYGHIITIATQALGIWSTVTMCDRAFLWAELYGKTTNAVWILQRFIMLVLHFFGDLFISARTEKWIDIVQRVAKMKTALGDDVYPKATKLKEQRIIFGGLVSFLACCLFDLCVYFHDSVIINSKFTGLTVLFLMTPFYVLVLIQMIIEMQLLLTLWYITSIMPSIIKSMEHLLVTMEVPDSRNQTAIDGPQDINGANNKISTPILMDRSRKPLKTLSLNITQGAHGMNKDILIKHVHQINVAYIEVCELMDIMNSYNGFLWILIILICVMRLIVCPYNIINILIKHSKSFWLISIEMSWCVFHLAQVYALVAPGHFIIEKTNELCLFAVKAAGRLKDYDYNAEIQMKKLFHTLVLNRPVFSPLGMCTISRGFMGTVLGAVMTYVVILIQLRSPVDG